MSSVSVRDVEAPAGSIVIEFVEWLRALTSGDGSDLHLKATSAPMLRETGRLRRLERAPLTAGELSHLAQTIVPAHRAERFREEGEVDFGHSVPGVGRFRANVFRQRDSVSMVFRRLRIGGPTFEEIGAPEIVQKLAEEPRGLILVTGPTGSGKTTTLAAMIEHINRTQAVHVVTIEDPIEVLFSDRMASVNQREVGQDSKTFLTALRASLRQDPDVILIGEMRDEETARAALQAAETGHLVMSTLHTTNATETVNRLLDFFPAHQQQQIRRLPSGALRGIICQRPVPAVGGGRVACLEVMVNTGRIADRIADPATTSEIQDVMAKGGFYGMRTFDQALLELVATGVVTEDEAMVAASEPHDLKLRLEAAHVSGGRRAPRLGFEQDVKPLFSDLERKALLWAYDLWDYTAVTRHATEILKKAEDGDPPFDPRWPEERIAALRSWIEDCEMAP